MNALFKALNDPARRTILELLRKAPLTAGEIADHFEMTKPSISYHLDLLRQADLVYSEKKGQQVFYELNTSVVEDAVSWLLSLSNTSKDSSS